MVGEGHFHYTCTFQTEIKNILCRFWVSVGLTGLPFGPSSPGGPLGPAGPAAPGGPASPFSPLSPLGPYRSRGINNTEGSTLNSKVCSYYGQKSDMRSEAAERNWIQSWSQCKQTADPEVKGDRTAFTYCGTATPWLWCKAKLSCVASNDEIRKKKLEMFG